MGINISRASSRIRTTRRPRIPNRPPRRPPHRPRPPSLPPFLPPSPHQKEALIPTHESRPKRGREGGRDRPSKADSQCVSRDLKVGCSMFRLSSRFHCLRAFPRPIPTLGKNGGSSTNSSSSSSSSSNNNNNRRGRSSSSSSRCGGDAPSGLACGEKSKHGK